MCCRPAGESSTLPCFPGVDRTVILGTLKTTPRDTGVYHFPGLETHLITNQPRIQQYHSPIDSFSKSRNIFSVCVREVVVVGGVSQSHLQEVGVMYRTYHPVRHVVFYISTSKSFYLLRSPVSGGLGWPKGCPKGEG